MRIKTSAEINLGFIKNVLGKLPNETDYKKKINAICTDTRIIERGDLFIALPGENFDGESFVNDAISKGAFTISKRNVSSDVLVEDTVKAIQKIACEYKKLLSVRYTVAITGSVGKTTTKNLTSRLLSKKYKVHSTYKNLNNEIGVPFTVLSAPSDTEILVIEAGMNHTGELSEISKCIEPDISLITKIGTAHIGNLGSRKRIAEAKGEITYGMKKPLVLVPYEEELLTYLPSRKTVSTKCREADFSLIPLTVTKDELTFDFYSKEVSLHNVKINSEGSHFAECMLFAISVCVNLGMSEKEILYAIEEPDFSERKTVNLSSGTVILNDSYNSSPEAVASAFETLELYGDKRSALLGDMLELGEYAEKLHFEIGRLAASKKLTHLYLFGKYSRYIKDGALSMGFDESSIFVNEDTESPEITANAIKRHSSGEVILFKASRKLKLERIISILK